MGIDPSFSRREREIIDILHRRGKASAREVRDQLTDPPSYSAVRALLRIMEQKGQVTHQQEGTRYVFAPKGSPAGARRLALRQVVSTFFSGSSRAAIAALLEEADTELSKADLEKLESIINKARKEGR